MFAENFNTFVPQPKSLLSANGFTRLQRFLRLAYGGAYAFAIICLYGLFLAAGAWAATLAHGAKAGWKLSERVSGMSSVRLSFPCAPVRPGSLIRHSHTAFTWVHEFGGLDPGSARVRRLHGTTKLQSPRATLLFVRRAARADTIRLVSKHVNCGRSPPLA